MQDDVPEFHHQIEQKPSSSMTKKLNHMPY